MPNVPIENGRNVADQSAVLCSEHAASDANRWTKATATAQLVQLFWEERHAGLDAGMAAALP
jgi:hypothetical protein